MLCNELIFVLYNYNFAFNNCYVDANENHRFSTYYYLLLSNQYYLPLLRAFVVACSSQQLGYVYPAARPIDNRVNHSTFTPCS